jgi:hypothetical protein
MLLWITDHLLPCAYKTIFGIDCPVCGSQRAFVEMLKGNLAKSFFIYPPLVPVLLLIVIGVLHVLNKDLIKAQLLKSYALFVLVVVLINYIIKLIL